ncbi:unnamed protein product [Vitrella brassicaformis CCMP3155]|uniref:Uncharacterized protein n=1 Tax=Vitrella brassicaformis (strain CCMP3155) TaxID=1169540 RepID=A0A0G4EX29_VITBC|nr:unnamed protein product [Vitrella brassicaformis CCMP3155]|eukprot:CEM03221.1 unnamed protein product [Vitrella brassicaformis CCMP3155]
MEVPRQMGDSRALGTRLLKKVLAEVRASEKRQDRTEEPDEVDLQEGVQFWPFEAPWWPEPGMEKVRDGDEVLYPYPSMIVSNGMSVDAFERPVSVGRQSPLEGLSCVVACPIKASDASRGVTVRDFVTALEQCEDPNTGDNEECEDSEGFIEEWEQQRSAANLLRPDIEGGGKTGFLINMVRVATGRYRVIWDDSK